MKSNCGNGKRVRAALKAAIVRKYHTQGRFAYAAKIDEGALSKIVNAIRDPNEDQKKLFSKLLKVPAEALFKTQPLA